MLFLFLSGFDWYSLAPSEFHCEVQVNTTLKSNRDVKPMKLGSFGLSFTQLPSKIVNQHKLA